MKITNLFLVMLFAVSLLAASVQPAAAADSNAAVACEKYHTVQRGEYLVQIARIYGVSWRWLAEVNELSNPSRIYPGQKLCVETKDGSGPILPPTGKSPSFSVVSVVEDDSVTILTQNFPKDVKFDVLIGKVRTRGADGVKVGTLSSGSGGAIKASFDIPLSMQDRRQLAIRLQSNAGSGYSLYSFFNNYTWGSGNSDGGSVIPTFSIASVVEDKTVTIKTSNFPKNVRFTVLMGRMGTRGVNGVKVGTIDSGKGGSFTATFDIPDEMRDRKQVAIRLENAATGYFAYNWFWNATTP